MVIANFTPDAYQWMHMGRAGWIKPGEIKDFEEARAKHILSAFGPRGLLSLKFGDNPEVKKKQALEIYKKFWMRQITRHNQDNEARRMDRRAYVAPQEILVEKATEFGIKLIGPWTDQPSDNQEVSRLRDENATLKQSLDSVMAQMKELTALVKGSKDVAERFEELDTPAQQVALEGGLKDEEVKEELDNITEEEIASEDEHAELKHRLKYMNGMQLGQWVMENAENIQTAWPQTEQGTDLVAEIKKKWDKILKDTPWPFPE